MRGGASLSIWRRFAYMAIRSIRQAHLGLLSSFVAGSLLLAACGGDATPTSPAGAAPTTGAGGAATAAATPAAAAAPTNTAVKVGSGTVLLNGAGATFPVPIYSKWFQKYSADINKDAAFNYQPTGSGAGISAITAKTVDFAGSDAP